MSHEKRFTLALSEEDYQMVKKVAEKRHRSVNSVIRLGARLGVEAAKADTGKGEDGLYIKKDGKEKKVIPVW